MASGSSGQFAKARNAFPVLLFFFPVLPTTSLPKSVQHKDTGEPLDAIFAAEQMRRLPHATLLVQSMKGLLLDRGN